jgi:RNA polymerase sigma-70 factor (ECF subfamily)
VRVAGYDHDVTLRGGASAEAQNFAAVLAAAQEGAPWACTTLWVEHAPAVAAFVTARGSREPEDLTSEVFLAVFEKLPRFSGGAPEFRSFVFSIAYRRLVDELRKRSFRGEHEEWSPQLDEQLGGRRSASAEDEALGRLGEASALSLLDGLPDDQRDVMVLRIVADLTIEQIANVLGKREGAVKALQRRALDNLRKKVPPTRTPARPSNDSE